jgi:Ca2+-binding RTX toxin-like protein
MLRQVRLTTVVVTFLIGCASLLLVDGCSGTSSEAPQEGQGHTEATNKDQGRTAEATSEDEARCQGTQPYYRKNEPGAVKPYSYTTNDLPGCPSGGLLLGTDGPDKLFGADGEDKIRGLGSKDSVYGGNGNDVIHAGPGDDDDTHAGFSEYGDDVIYGDDGDDWIGGGGFGEDVIYGGDGSDHILTFYDHQADKLYCGKGKDYYAADKHDYVDSSCEVKMGSNA